MAIYSDFYRYHIISVTHRGTSLSYSEYLNQNQKWKEHSTLQICSRASRTFCLNCSGRGTCHRSHKKVVSHQLQGQLDFVESLSLLESQSLEMLQNHWLNIQMTSAFQTPLKRAGSLWGTWSLGLKHTSHPDGPRKSQCLLDS